ncbi:MAG: hypothetical protein P8Z38_09130 [Robiginitalea sp.]
MKVRSLYPFALVFLFLTACKSDPKKEQETIVEIETVLPHKVSVVTKSMEFYAPDTIPSGWNTLIYENQSTEPHFILLDKYPEGKRLADTKKEVIPPFDEGMALIMEGKNEEAMEAFGKLPEWSTEIVFSGGTGLISPGETAVTTVKLDPGYYVMECYVRMPDGRFHVSMGMAKELVVSEEDSGDAAPEADIALSLSSTEGIVLKDTITAGEKIISVQYGDQIVHENFMGHDINLVRMEDDADMEELQAWLNWATPTGLMSSTTPDGIVFLGGTNDSPSGSIQFFKADLQPGRYAFVSEVPNAGEKGMLKVFTVE